MSEEVREVVEEAPQIDPVDAIDHLDDGQLHQLQNKARHLIQTRQAKAIEQIPENVWNDLFTEARTLVGGESDEITLDARVKGYAAIHWIGRAYDGENAEREESCVKLVSVDVDVLNLETTELLNRLPRLKPKFEEMKAKVDALYAKVKEACANAPNPEELEKFVWDRINNAIDGYGPEYHEYE